MTARDELQEVNSVIRDRTEQVNNLQRILRPYWSEKNRIEKAIKRTHRYHETPIYGWDKDANREVFVDVKVDVIGFLFNGAPLRVPLFPKLDALSVEYGPTRSELANVNAELKRLLKVQEQIRKTVEREDKKSQKQSGSEHRCAQCNGTPDGTERDYDGVWLHPECARFYQRRQ